MSKFIFPDDVSIDYLNELADQISFREAQYLVNKKSAASAGERRSKIAAQVPDVANLIAQYTENQYVEQEVEIMQGLKASFRTLVPQNMDDSLDFAANHSENADNYTRVLNRIRLSYGLGSINGKRVGEPHFVGSYFDAVSGFENMQEFFGDMQDAAKSRFNQLSIHGLADRISEAYGMWETIVWEKINGIDSMSDVLKKSTGGSGTEQ